MRLLLAILLIVPLHGARANTCPLEEDLCPLIANLPADAVKEVEQFAVHYGRARALIDAGDFDEADKEMRNAAAASTALGGILDFAIHERIGDLRRNQWRLDDARRSYTAALDTPAAPAGRRADVARKIAEAASLSGALDKALAWNEEAAILAAREGVDPLLRIRIMLQRATLLQESGRERGGDALRAEATAMARRTDRPDDLITVLIEIGTSRIQRGDYAGALSQFYELAELIQQANRPDEEAYVWSVIAMIYIVIEDDSSTKSALERGAELAERSQNPFAKSMINAVAVARRFVADEASGAELVAVFSALMTLPLARDTAAPADQTALENAFGEFDPAQPLPLRGIGKPLRALHGIRLLEQGMTADAREVLLEVLDGTTNHDFRSFYLSMVGGSYLMEQNIEEAIRYYKEAVDVLELAARDLRGEEMVIEFFGSDRKVAYDVLIKLLAMHGCHEESLSYSERARSRAFLQMIGNRRINPLRKRVPAEMETLRARIREWEQQARFGRASVRQTAQRDLVHARRRYRELMVRAKVSDPYYEQIVAIPPLDLEGIREELPVGSTLVSYYVTQNRAHAWVVDRDHLDHVRLPWTDVEAQRVVCWAAELRSEGRMSRGMAPDGQDCAQDINAEEIYDLLIAPLREKLRHARLILVPHGVLHYVPFAALMNPVTHRYLIEDFTITNVPSISVLRLLRGRETPVDGRVLIIGDPVSATGDRRLKGAQREAVRTARRFGARSKIGAAATEGLLYDLRGRFDLVHIGAHAEYDADNPLFSRIALARDAGRDGALEVHEILADVDFTGVNLVVLSACGTGRGTPTGGDEIVGLTRAVHHAGSPGVISTLWDIDDAATATLMEEFYGRLRVGASAAEALRDAQLAMLRRAPYRAPAYWAAFVLSGNPQGRWGRR